MIAGCSKLVLPRQTRGITRHVANAAAHRAAQQPGSAPFAVAVLSHEWDETRSLFRRPDARRKVASASRRGAQAGVQEQTMVQRGTFRTSFTDSHGNEGRFSDEWLVQPLVVEGTAAIELLPGLHRGLPEVCRPGNTSGLEALVAGFDTFVFAPIGDKSSANVRVLKVWGHYFENDLPSDLRKHVIYLPETCQAHSHHRGKLQVQSLRPHTMTHFCVANLNRAPQMQGRMALMLESAVQDRLLRKLQPPPMEGERLRVFFDILFGLEADRHRRKTGKSAFHNDLQTFMSMVNGDVTSDRLEHYCWSEDGRPCCQTKDICQEKLTVAVVNLLSPAGSIPCESRWTNLFAGHELEPLGRQGAPPRRLQRNRRRAPAGHTLGR